MNNTRAKFNEELGEGWISGFKKASVVVVAVQLPTGAIETITNTQCLEEKLRYYRDAYDDEFRLKTNPEVQIIGFMIV